MVGGEAYLVDSTGKFMAHYETSWRRLMTTENMQFTTAECGVFDLDDNVAGILDHRHRSVLNGNLMRTLEDDRLHGFGGRHYVQL